MRNYIVFLIFSTFFLIPNVNAQSVFEKWPAIEEFHEVLAATFHPAEEGNLEPIKSRYEEVIQKAEALLKSTIAAELKNSKITASTEKLYIQSKSLQKLMLLKAADPEILKLLSEIHDTFHEIVELCADEKK